MTLIKRFNNRGAGQNASGVCEAAVCKWFKAICLKVRCGQILHGCSARHVHYEHDGADIALNIPSTGAANDLYVQFDSDKYPFRFLSYLEGLFRIVSGNSRPSDARRMTTFGCNCSHYSGEICTASTGEWHDLISDMRHDDLLFLNLQHNSDAGSDGKIYREGHAVGVYRAGTNIWIFDPLEGLHMFHHAPNTEVGLIDPQTRCSIPNLDHGVNMSPRDEAANYLSTLTRRWNTCLYYGLHLEPPKNKLTLLIGNNHSVTI